VYRWNEFLNPVTGSVDERLLGPDAPLNDDFMEHYVANAIKDIGTMPF
jgi:hypothetical protein